MSTPGLTSDSTVEVISAYTATNQSVQAVSVAPGWYVIGALFVPVSTPARLEVIGSVTDASLTMTVRLFDLTQSAAVSGSDAVISGVIDDRELSGVFAVAGGHVYQLQAQVIGGSGPTLFGTVKNAGLTN